MQEKLPKLSNRLILSNTEGHYVLPHENIVRIEANSNYTHFHMVGDKKYLSTKSMKSVENKLPKDSFLRIHKSHMINLDYLHRVSRTKLYLRNGEEVPLSRGYRSVLMDIINSAK